MARRAGRVDRAGAGPRGRRRLPARARPATSGARRRRPARDARASLGLVPDLGGTKPLVDLVGYSRALEICATGRWVVAQPRRPGSGWPSSSYSAPTSTPQSATCAAALAGGPGRRGPRDQGAAARRRAAAGYDEQRAAERAAQAGGCATSSGGRGTGLMSGPAPHRRAASGSRRGARVGGRRRRAGRAAQRPRGALPAGGARRPAPDRLRRHDDPRAVRRRRSRPAHLLPVHRGARTRRRQRPLDHVGAPRAGRRLDRAMGQRGPAASSGCRGWRPARCSAASG